jgi:hypothetical protein
MEDDHNGKTREADDEARVQEIIDEAMEKMASASKSKSKGPDKKKAKAIIGDAIKKLEGLRLSEHGKVLKERLEAMMEDDDSGKSKKKGKKKTAKEREDEAAHEDFAHRLNQEKAKKLDFGISDVKAEFKETYGKDAKSLLCSGCKLVAARLEDELGVHDVHESESPAAMIESKRRALDATCGSFRHLRVGPSETGLRFQASEADDPPGEHSALRMEQKLCHALLEDAKFDLLAKMIQKKVPTSPFHRGQVEKKDNYERWLCANRVKMCKRSEVKDDDEEDEEL